MPGSPFPSSNFLNLSVSKKFLFGYDGTNVYSYSIAADGALKQVAETDVTHVSKGCKGYSSAPIQIDGAGSTLYVSNPICPGVGETIASYRIERDGELQYLGDSSPDDYSNSVTVLGNDKYAYVGTCEPPPGSETWVPVTETYTRESNGLLITNNDSFPMPPPGDPAKGYPCPSAIAADPTNHLALAENTYDPITASGYTPFYLASYTADSHGNLTTRSTPQNMAQAQTAGVGVMSISPTGKLLAVSGGEFWRRVSGLPFQRRGPDHQFHPRDSS